MSIRTLRRLRGLNQTQLAEKAGVSQSSVSRAEQLEDGVTLEVMRAIAAALDVELIDLFTANRSAEEFAILEAFRGLSIERQRGWGDMAKAILSETAQSQPESDQADRQS